MSVRTLGINSLAPGFEYDVRVRGIFKGVPSEWGPVETIDIFSDTSSGTADKAPQPPTGFTVVPTIDSYIIKWTAPTTNNDGSVLKDMKDYVLEISDVTFGTADATYIIPEYQQPGDLSAIDKAHQFEFTYKMNKDVYGTPIKTLYARLYARDATNNRSTPVTAQASNAAPTAPTSPSATPVVGGIAVSWSAGGADTVEYVLQAHTASMANPPVTGTEVYRGTVLNFTHITTGLKYYRVGAVDIFGQTTWSSEVSATAGSAITYNTPNPPTSFTNAWVGANYRVGWTASSSSAQDIDRYKVDITANSTTKTFYTQGTFYDITPEMGKDFGSSWPYTITAVSITTVGPSGLTSSALAGSGFTSAPSTPTAPTLTPSIGSGGIALTWSAPSDPNGIIKEIQVYANTSTTASPTNAVYAGTGTGFTYSISPLFNGTYYFKARVRDVFGRYSSYSAEATQAVTNVGVPTSLSLTPALDPADPTNRTSMMAVNWTIANTIVYSGSKIRYRIGAGNWTEVDVGAMGTAGSAVTYHLRNLVPGATYIVDVALYDFKGTLGTWTNAGTQIATTDSTAPASTLSPTATAGATSILVSWTGATESDAVAGAGRYDVEIATNSTFSTGVIKQTQITGVSGASISSSFTGLTGGTSYYARVRAVDATGNLGTWNVYGGGTPTATLVGSAAHVYATPTAPTSLVDSWVGANYRISWTASTTPSVEDIAQYKVVITANAVAKTYYTTDVQFDITPELGKSHGASWPYTPTNISVYAVGPTALTSSALAKTSAFAAAPSTPTAPTLTPSITTGGIRLTWTAPTDANKILKEIQIYANTATTASPTNAVYTGTANAYTYTPSAIFNDTYYFKSRVIDVFGRASSYSAEATQAITTVGAPTALSMSSSLDTADPTNKLAMVTVNWTTPNSISYAGTKIRYRIGAGLWTEIDVGKMGNPNTAVSYNIRGLVPNTTYAVNVIAYDFTGALGNSGTWTLGDADGNILTAVDSTGPSAPTSPVLASGATNLLVSWVNPSDADFVLGRGRTEVEIATDSGFTTGKKVQVVPGGIAGATNVASFSGLVAATTYWARITCFDANNNASTVTPTSPTSLAVGSAGGASDGNVPTGTIPTPTAISGIGGIHVRWSAMTNADVLSYEVHVGTTSGFSPSGSTLIGSVAGTYFFAKVDGTGAALSYGQNYYFKLRPFDVDGPHASYGSASGAAQITTVANADLTDAAVTLSKISTTDLPRLGNMLTNGDAEAHASLGWTGAISSGLTRQSVPNAANGNYVWRSGVGTNKYYASDLLIPVNTTDPYYMSVMMRRIVNVANYAYMGLTPYDKDGAVIYPYRVYSPYPDTYMTLTADVNPGDTAISVDSTAFITFDGNDYAAFNADDSGLYADLPSTNYKQITGHTATTLTLAAGGATAFAASGTKVRYHKSAGTFLYIDAKDMNTDVSTGEWLKYEGIITGVNAVNGNSGTKFRIGTAAVKPIVLMNYGGGGATQQSEFDSYIFEVATNTTRITDNAITTPKITAGAVTATQIAANTITAGQIAANTITAGQIQALTITAAEIAANTITAAKIAAGTITTNEIAANTIVAGDIAAGTITGTNIAATTITAANIVSGTITTTQIAANTIVAGNIAANTITAGQIAAGTITATEIAATTITGGNIAANTITGGNIAATTITAANIVGGTITATQIASGTITGDKISAATGYLGSLTIGTGTSASGEIKSGNYVASTSGWRIGQTSAGVSTLEINQGTIKANAITTGTLSADRISGGTFNAGTMTVTNLSASSITTGTLSADRISGGTFDASLMTVTNLNAGSITAGTLSADRISGGTFDASLMTVTNLNAGSITAGTLSAARLGISGSGSNMIPLEYCGFEYDPTYYTGKFATTNTTASVVTSGTTSPWQGGQSLRMVTTNTTCETYLAPTSTTYNINAEVATYIVSAYVKAASGTPTVKLRFKASTGAVQSSSAIATSTSWTRISAAFTAPASTTAFQIGFADLSATGTLYADGIMVEKRIGNTSTPTGFVPSSATTIDGSGITTNSLNADRITAGTITGDRINAATGYVGSLTIGTGTSAAGEIKSGNYPTNGWRIGQDASGVSTLDIKNGTITANAITAGTLSADRISGGTLDAGTMTVTNLSASSINTGTLSAAYLEIGGTNVNLIPAQWSDFEYNPYYYVGKMDGANAVAVATTDEKFFKSQSCKVTTSVSPNNTVFLGISNTDYNFKVLPSTKYIISAYIYYTGTTGQTISFRYKPQSTGSNNDYPATIDGTITAIPSGSWQRIYTTFTTGGSDDLAVIGFRSFSLVGTYYIDGVMLEKAVGSVVSPSPWAGAPQTVIEGDQITTGTVVTDRVGLGLFTSNKLENGSFERTGVYPPEDYRTTVTSTTPVSIPGWTLSRVSGDTVSFAAHEWGNSWSDDLNITWNPSMEDQSEEVSCTVQNSGETITANSHGLAAGNAIIFTEVSASVGITAGTVYYVSATSLATNTFRIASTPGGAAIAFSGDASAKYVSAPPAGWEEISNGTNGGYMYSLSGNAASGNWKYASTYNVIGKLLKGNVATVLLETNLPILKTETVEISNVDATFNGSYTVTNVESYSEPRSIEVSSYTGSGTTATITTKSRHNLSVGQVIRVEGIDYEGVGPYWDGTHTVASVTGDTTFTYQKPSVTGSGTGYGAYVYADEFNAISYAKAASNVEYSALDVPGTISYGRSALLGLSGSTSAGAYYGISQTVDVDPSEVSYVTAAFWYKKTSNAKMSAWLGNSSNPATPTTFTGTPQTSLNQTATAWTRVVLEYPVVTGDTTVRLTIAATSQTASNTGTVYVDGIQTIFGRTSDLQDFDHFYSEPARSGLAKVILGKSTSASNGTQVVSDPIQVRADTDYAVGMYYYGTMGVGIIEQVEYSASLPFSASATYNLNLNNYLLPYTIPATKALSDVSSWRAENDGYARLVVKNATTSPSSGAGYLYVEDVWFMEKGASSGELTDAGIRLFDSNGVETMSMMSDSSDGGDFIQLGSGVYLDGPTNSISTVNLAVDKEFTVAGETIEDALWNYPKGVVARGSRTSAGNATAGGAKPYLEVQAQGLDPRRAYKIWTTPIRCYNSNGAAGQTEIAIRYNSGTSSSNNGSTKPVTGDTAVVSARVQGNNNFNYQYLPLERYWSPSEDQAAASNGTFRFLLTYQGFGTTAANSVYINGSTNGEFQQLNIEDIGPLQPDIGIDRGEDADGSTTKRTYTKTLKPAWVGSYRGSGNLLQNNYIFQGQFRDYGDEASAVAFNTSVIPDSATIKKVEVYLYCYNSTLASGVDAQIGLHKDPGNQAPSKWSNVDGKSTTRISHAFSKKQGDWVDISTLSARVGGLQAWSASGTSRYTGILVGPAGGAAASRQGAFVGKSGYPPGGSFGVLGRKTYQWPKLRVTYSD